MIRVYVVLMLFMVWGAAQVAIDAIAVVSG